MKQMMDIEGLLDFAYRQQCVDRFIPATAPRGPAFPASCLGQYSVLGTRVDTSGFAAATAERRIKPDALIIHDAVLALGEMWIEWRDEDDVVVWDRASAEAAGMVIEHPARDRWQIVPRFATGLDAPMPSPLVAVPTVALIVVNAKNGTRPEWHEGWRPAAWRPARGVGADAWGRKRKRAAVSSDVVVYARAQYSVWHASLSLLAAQLNGALEGFEVVGPQVAAAPWVKTAKAA
jgi:hypothetical protein